METWRTLLTVFPHALVAGLMISVVFAVLGVAVILKRMVFIGAALAEVAAAGVATALVFGWPPLAGAAVGALATGLLLSGPFETGRLPRDTVIGALFVVASAAAILIAAHTGLGLAEVRNLLYGDLIVIRRHDLIAVVTATALVMLAAVIWRRPLLYTLVDREAARVVGVPVVACEMFFYAALSLTIAVSSRAAGAMLSFAFLVLPGATALLLSRRWGFVLIIAVVIAATATAAGLWAALAWELPANQVIVVLLAAPLAAVAAGRSVSGPARRWRRRRHAANSD